DHGLLHAARGGGGRRHRARGGRGGRRHDGGRRRGGRRRGGRRDGGRGRLDSTGRQGEAADHGLLDAALIRGSGRGGRRDRGGGRGTRRRRRDRRRHHHRALEAGLRFLQLVAAEGAGVEIVFVLLPAIRAEHGASSVSEGPSPGLDVR